jgi:hypothetical protein
MEENILNYNKRKQFEIDEAENSFTFLSSSNTKNLLNDCQSKLMTDNITLLSVETLWKIMMVFIKYKMSDEFIIVHTFYHIQNNEISLFESLLRDESMHINLHDLFMLICQNESKDILTYVLDLYFYDKLQLSTQRMKFSKKYLKFYALNHKSMNALSKDSRNCFQLLTNVFSYHPTPFIQPFISSPCSWFHQSSNVKLSLDCQEFLIFWKGLCKTNFASITIPMFDVIYQKTIALLNKNNNKTNDKGLIVEIIQSEKYKSIILEILQQTCLEGNDVFFNFLVSKKYLQDYEKEYWKNNKCLFEITKENKSLLEFKPESVAIFEKIFVYLESL